jgi:hypothetical protein
MRLSAHASPDGTTFRVYRKTDGFKAQCRVLLRYTGRSAYPLFLGGYEDDTTCLLSIGPIPLNEVPRFACQWRIQLASSSSSSAPQFINKEVERQF